MVAKITSGMSVYGALYYNQEKVEKGKAQTLGWNRIMERPDGTAGIPECMRSFEPYLAMNRRTEKPVIHLSLNPHPTTGFPTNNWRPSDGNTWRSWATATNPTSFSGTRTTRVHISISSPCA